MQQNLFAWKTELIIEIVSEFADALVNPIAYQSKKDELVNKLVGDEDPHRKPKRTDVVAKTQSVPKAENGVPHPPSIASFNRAHTVDTPTEVPFASGASTKSTISGGLSIIKSPSNSATTGTSLIGKRKKICKFWILSNFLKNFSLETYQLTIPTLDVLKSDKKVMALQRKHEKNLEELRRRHEKVKPKFFQF